MTPDPKETKRGTPAAPSADVPPSDDEETSDLNDISDDEELDELGELDLSRAEFQSINESLDSLNSAMDTMERKNDSLHAQLLQLLESQRETLKLFKEETDSDSGDDEEPPSENRSDTLITEQQSEMDQQLVEPMEQN